MKNKKMLKLMAVIHFLLAALVAVALFAAEPNPRLVEIAREKQRLEEQAERGRLLIENAQLKFQRLVEEEKAILEKEEADQKK